MFAEALVKKLGRSPRLQPAQRLRLVSSLVSQPWFPVPQCFNHHERHLRGIVTARNGFADGLNSQPALARIEFLRLGDSECIAGNIGPRESRLNQRDADTELPELMIERFRVAFDGMFAGGVDRHVRRREESHN